MAFVLFGGALLGLRDGDATSPTALGLLVVGQVLGRRRVVTRGGLGLLGIVGVMSRGGGVFSGDSGGEDGSLSNPLTSVLCSGNPLIVRGVIPI